MLYNYVNYNKKLENCYRLTVTNYYQIQLASSRGLSCVKPFDFCPRFKIDLCIMVTNTFLIKEISSD